MTGDRFFTWEEVNLNREQIDWTVYPISMQYAQADYLDQAKPCPECGTPAVDLFWLGMQSSNEKWDKGEGKAGFLTICEKCNLQVDFFRDDDLEQAVIDGGVRL